MARPLRGDEDAFGRLLLDFLDGVSGQAFLERDDGSDGPAPAGCSSPSMTSDPHPERESLRARVGARSRRRCGGGAAQSRGSATRLRVVAIDISPGAVEACRRRGIQDVRPLALEDADASIGVFDTVLMMCGNFGLLGNRIRTESMLRRLAGVTGSDAGSSSARSARTSIATTPIARTRGETSRAAA